LQGSPEDRVISEGDGMFHQPEPSLVVAVVEVLGRDVLDSLFRQVFSVLVPMFLNFLFSVTDGRTK
jgi:hypothetical protein